MIRLKSKAKFKEGRSFSLASSFSPHRLLSPSLAYRLYLQWPILSKYLLFVWLHDRRFRWWESTSPPLSLHQSSQRGYYSSKSLVSSTGSLWRQHAVHSAKVRIGVSFCSCTLPLRYLLGRQWQRTISKLLDLQYVPWILENILRLPWQLSNATFYFSGSDSS